MRSLRHITWLWAWLSALLTAGCTGGPSEPQEIRILTLNLLTFAVAPDVDLRTQGAIDLILAETPDLVALQEVAQSGAVANRAEVIAAATGYFFVWTPTEVDEDADYHGGPAVLSRWPIESQRIIDLPYLDFGGEVIRRAIQVTAITPLGPINLVGTHTTTNSDESRQVGQAAVGAESLLEMGGVNPSFYAGDFNAEPDSLAMRTLRGEEPKSLPGVALEDAWQTAHPDDPGYTYPSRAPARRIDYIYTVQGSEKRAQVEGCKLVLDEPQQMIYASDHLGVLCQFTFAPVDSLSRRN